MRSWADRGRTLPGRHDPEWARLAAAPTASARWIRAEGINGA